MNLPYPFNKASDVRADTQGAISLIDDQGKALARIPMTTAFDLSPEAEGFGSGSGYGSGFGQAYGSGVGSGYGSGYGDGYGYGLGGSGSGYGFGQTDGSGRSK